MELKDGGHAFPTQAWENDGDRVLQYQEPGMTLRDYFAAHALAVVAPGQYPPDGVCLEYRNFGAAARDAYEMADAMLKARQGASND